jgi:hypothetical protein
MKPENFPTLTILFGLPCAMRRFNLLLSSKALFSEPDQSQKFWTDRPTECSERTLAEVDVNICARPLSKRGLSFKNKLMTEIENRLNTFEENHA